MLSQITFEVETSGSFELPVWFWILYAAILIIWIIGMWTVYAKAGQPGWAAIIPIYNVLVLLRIVGREWWWILLMLIPIVNIVVWIIVLVDLSKSFGHGVGFALGLLFLPFIFYLVLAFGDSTYQGPAGAAGSMPPPPAPPAPPA